MNKILENFVCRPANSATNISNGTRVLFGYRQSEQQLCFVISYGGLLQAPLQETGTREKCRIMIWYGIIKLKTLSRINARGITEEELILMAKQFWTSLPWLT